LCDLRDFDRLELLPLHRDLVQKEWYVWHRLYLPGSRLLTDIKGDRSLEGKEVMDLGAGCGETAFLFLNHGASRVHCFESDPAALELLKRNFGGDPRVTINQVQIGFIKIDIEGAEKDMVVETHFPAKWERFIGGGTSVFVLEKYAGFHAMIFFSQPLHRLKVRIAHAGRRVLDAIRAG
jgi:hypothetical protein